MFDTPIEFPSLDQRLAFLGLVDAAPAVHASPITARSLAVALPSSDAAQARAAVAGSTIVSVAGEVSESDEQDVLDCTLYLEQYTDTRYNRETEWYQWLQHFTLGLWHHGWIHQRPVMLDTQELVLNEPISGAILETLRPNVSGSMYSAAMHAFDALKDNLRASMLLAQKSGSERGRQFQTLPCGYDAEGRLVVMLIHCWYFAAVDPDQFLFWKWQDHHLTLIQHYGTFTLDRKRFDQIAPAMRAKITQRSREYLLRM